MMMTPWILNSKVKSKLTFTEMDFLRRNAHSSELNNNKK